MPTISSRTRSRRALAGSPPGTDRTAPLSPATRQGPAKRRYAVILGNLGNTRDRFCSGYKENPGMWDDDMIVGTVDSVCCIEMLYWLDRCGYQGWLSMDQYPYREQAAEAIGESIRWLRRFGEVVRRHRQEIDAVVAANDAVATSRFLRKVLVASCG